MTTFNELDFGPSHAWLKPTVGQQLGKAFVEGDGEIGWPRGSTLEEQQVDLYVQPWQALGAAPAGTRQALLYLLRQLEELVSRAEPIYIGWTTTAFPGAFTAVDVHDGWYVVSQAAPVYRRYVVTGGVVTAPLTAVRLAPASSQLGLRWSGGALPSTYTATPVPLIAYPIGSTQQVPTQLSRTGGEGTIPISILTSGSTINPAYFARPGTVAGLFAGGVRVYDTIVAGGNAVPSAGGGFANANWVQVYGRRRNFLGDVVVTNGLLLLRMAMGGTGAPDLYVWNTQGTAGWNQIGSLQYKDSPGPGSVGNIRGIDLLAAGYQTAIARLTLGTANGNYARFLLQLDAGQYGAAVLPDLRTQANTQAFALNLTLTSAYKIVANSGLAYDVNVGALDLTPQVDAGWSVVIGTTASGPLAGFGWQNPPNTGQPSAGSTTAIGFGETTGPAQATPRRYFIWAAPYNVSGGAANLLGEAESGTLDTPGWSSVVDGSASAGNAAQCANGTVTGKAATWGTAFVPVPGVYDLWVWLKLGSLVSSTSQMKIGLYNSTDGVFVASTTYAPNSAALVGGTSYIRVKVCAGVTPTAGKSMRVRAETTATTTTTWNMDESALVPARSATPGQGDLPEDIFRQLMLDKATRLVRG